MSNYTVNIVTTADLAALNNLTIASQKQFETAERLRKQYADSLGALQQNSQAYQNASAAIAVLDQKLQSTSAQLVYQQQQLRMSAQALNGLGTEAGRLAAAAQLTQAAAIGQQLGQQSGVISRVTDALQQFRAAYNGAGQGINGVMAALDAGLGSWLAWGYAAKQAVDVVRDSVREFAQAEAVIVRMESALARNGQLTGEMSKRYQDLASSLQDATGIADERWLGVLTKLTQQGADPEKIEQYGEAVKNLAALMGGNVERAAFAFQRAMNGNFRALTMLGVTIDKNMSQQEKLASAMSQLAKKGGGDFDALMKTITGRTDDFGNKLSDLKELIGEEFAPGYKFFLAGMSQLTGFAIAAVQNLKKEMEGLSFIADALKRAFPTLQALADEFGKVTQKNNEQAASQARAKEIGAQFTEELKNQKEASEEAKAATKGYVDELKSQADAQLELLDAETKLKLAQIDADEKTNRIDKVEASRRRLNVKTEAENKKFAIEQEKTGGEILIAEQDYAEKVNAFNLRRGRIDTATKRNQAAREIEAAIGRADRNSPVARQAAAEIAAKHGLALTDDLLSPKAVENTFQEVQEYSRGDEDGERTRKEMREIREAEQKLRSLRRKQTTQVAARGFDVQRENLTNAVTFSQEAASGTIEAKMSQRSAANAVIANQLAYGNFRGLARQELESQKARNDIEIELLKKAQELLKALSAGNPAEATRARAAIVTAINDANNRRLTVGGQRVTFNAADYNPTLTASYGGRGLTPAAVGIASRRAVGPTAPQFADGTLPGGTGPILTGVPGVTPTGAAYNPQFGTGVQPGIAYQGYRAQIGAGTPIPVPMVSSGVPGVQMAPVGFQSPAMAVPGGGLPAGGPVPQFAPPVPQFAPPVTPSVPPVTASAPPVTPPAPPVTPPPSPSGQSAAPQTGGESSIYTGIWKLTLEAEALVANDFFRRANLAAEAVSQCKAAIAAAEKLPSSPQRTAALVRLRRALGLAEAAARRLPSTGFKGLKLAFDAVATNAPGAKTAQGIMGGLKASAPKFAEWGGKAVGAVGKGFSAVPLLGETIGLARYAAMPNTVEGELANDSFLYTATLGRGELIGSGYAGEFSELGERFGNNGYLTSEERRESDLNRKDFILSQKGERAARYADEAKGFGLVLDREKGKFVTRDTFIRRAYEKRKKDDAAAASKAASDESEADRIAAQVAEESASIPKTRGQAASQVSTNTARAMVGVRADADRKRMQDYYDRQLDENKAQIAAAKAEGRDTSSLEGKRVALGNRRTALDDKSLNPQAAINKVSQVEHWQRQLDAHGDKALLADREGRSTPEFVAQWEKEREQIATRLQAAKNIGKPVEVKPGSLTPERMEELQQLQAQATASGNTEYARRLGLYIAKATPTPQGTVQPATPETATGTTAAQPATPVTQPPGATGTADGTAQVADATKTATQSTSGFASVIANFTSSVVTTQAEAVKTMLAFQKTVEGMKTELATIQARLNNDR